MTKSKIVANLFFFSALLFLLVAVLPTTKLNGSLDETFLVLGIVFLILGITTRKKNRGGS